MSDDKPEPVVDRWEPIRQPSGVYYSVQRLVGDGMAALRDFFPDAKADEMNAVLFSTSGVHGSYCTIEDVEEGGDEAPDSVTFVMIQPRIVCMRYGNAKPRTQEDFAFLKQLRASSRNALSKIGGPDE